MLSVTAMIPSDENPATRIIAQTRAGDVPHKLFAVFTNPDGKLLFRKMWSMRLAGYLGSIGGIHGKGWDKFIRDAEVGQVWHEAVRGQTWMALIRIRDDEDRDDTE
jgi:hypothetical protein